MRVMANAGGFTPLHSVMPDARDANTALKMAHLAATRFWSELHQIFSHASTSTLYLNKFYSYRASQKKVGFRIAKFN